MSKLIVCDFNNLLNKFFYGYKDSFVQRGTVQINTSTVFGFTNFTTRILRKYPNAKIVYCLEGERQKQELLESYKAQRKESNKEMYEHNENIYKLLSALPEVAFAKNELTEADDVIASVALKYKDKHDVVIYSKDKDFWQLIGHNVRVADSFANDFGYITPKHVFDKMGVYPEVLLPFRVLCGDVSDNIKPPVPNVKKEYKAQIAELWNGVDMEKFESILNKEDSIKKNISAKYLEALEAVERNVKLMDLLKYEKTPIDYKIHRAVGASQSLIEYYKLFGYESYLSSRGIKL